MYSRYKANSHNATLSLKSVFTIFIVLLSFISSTIAVISSSELKSHFTSQTLNEWIDDFPTESLVYLIGLENNYFKQGLPSESRPPSLSSIALELFTSIQFGDIRSLLGSEIPGYKIYDTKILVAGEGTDYTTLPIESAAPLEVLLQEREASIENLNKLDTNENENTKPKPPINTTNGRKVAYIYHSHSRESFLPYLKGETDPDKAHNSKINITMVGQKLGEALEERGIGTEVDTTDIISLLNTRNLSYYNAYNVAREVVETATSENKDLNFLFDIHRDAQPKEVTTATINGKAYARLFFIIGTDHKNYEKNLNFAKEINTQIENKYPGISRGVLEKNKSQGNGVYNQDLSPNSIIIEIGGVGNNLEELYRTTEALADVISEYYWNEQKVNAE